MTRLSQLWLWGSLCFALQTVWWVTQWSTAQGTVVFEWLQGCFTSAVYRFIFLHVLCMSDSNHYVWWSARHCNEPQHCKYGW